MGYIIEEWKSCSIPPVMRSIIAVIVFSFASVICSAASVNISPFVPAEPSKMEADIARVEFLKTKFARMSQQQQQQPQPEVKLQEVETTTNNSNIPGDTSDTVPTVVGSVLAAMILLVMVSYFVIRRRAIKK